MPCRMGQARTPFDLDCKRFHVLRLGEQDRNDVDDRLLRNIYLPEPGIATWKFKNKGKFYGTRVPRGTCTGRYMY